MKDRIKSIEAFEILNAKGNPTVEVVMTTESGAEAKASVPAGTSTGTNEAFVLTDHEERYDGKGVRKAVENVNRIIAPALIGHELTSIDEIDSVMLALDGTPNKSKLGANAILPVSVAYAKVRAKSLGLPLWSTLTDRTGYRLPDIIATVIAGGEFGVSGLEFEDYLYIFHGFDSFSDELEALVRLRKALERKITGIYGPCLEDGGAIAAPIESTEKAFELMMATVKEEGFEGRVSLGLDVAASELYSSDTGRYKVGNGKLTRKDLAAYYEKLCTGYPLEYLEDGFDENDAEGFGMIRDFPFSIQNVGDDLFTSNITYLEKYHGCANGLLLKINQIGSVSEAIKAAMFAKDKGLDVTVSLRSGETDDDFISDLAVAVGARQIKLGSPVRMERNVKYNRLLKIERELEKAGK